VPYFIEAGFITEENGIYKNKQNGEVIETKFLEKIILYQQPRLKKLSEIAVLSDYFFVDKLEYNKELLKWKNASVENTVSALDEVYNLLSKIEVGEWAREKIEAKVLERIPDFNSSFGFTENDRGYLLWPLRVSLCGQKCQLVLLKWQMFWVKKKL